MLLLDEPFSPECMCVPHKHTICDGRIGLLGMQHGSEESCYLLLLLALAAVLEWVEPG